MWASVRHNTHDLMIKGRNDRASRCGRDEITTKWWPRLEALFYLFLNFLSTHEGYKPVRNMKSRQSDKKKTKQVRIDAGLHKKIKIKAANENTHIKTLIEGCLADLLEVKND